MAALSPSPSGGYGAINGSINEAPKDAWEIASTGSFNQYDNIFETERAFGDGEIDPERRFAEEKEKHEAKKLGQFRATAIAGNDITCEASTRCGDPSSSNHCSG